MSVQLEIDRIRTARDKIRAKLIDLGLGTSNNLLDECATSIAGIENNGAVNAKVQEGETYTIPKGYHNGSGTVAGVSGGGNYTLQSKTVTPTKEQVNVTPTSGYYGLSDVTVEPIPEAYQNVTSVTATAPDVLANKIIVTKEGKAVAGTMPNNGAVTQTLTTSTTSYTVPKGYHSGTGTVKITTEEKAATPTELIQTITPGVGKVLSKVTVNAIPDNYGNVGSLKQPAGAEQILVGNEVISQDSSVDFPETRAVVVKGTMPDNGAISKTLSTTSTSYTIPKGYHSGSGSVNIKLESKTAIPNKEKLPQKITPTAGSVLKEVVVNPIPDEYITTTDANALAGEIVQDKIAYVKGEKVTGTMPVNLPDDHRLDTKTSEYIIPEGYHDGAGTVSINGETVSATPTKSIQQFTPSNGNVYFGLTVNPIPEKYVDTTSGNVTAADVLDGKIAWAGTTEITGSMPNNGATGGVINGLTVVSYAIPAGYTTGGTVTFSNDIETALAAI